MLRNLSFIPVAAAALALSLPSPAEGNVYVAVPADDRGGTLRLSVSNDDASARRMIATLVPQGAAGTHGGSDLGTLWVGPRQTRVVDLPLSATGALLALDLRPRMTLDARLLLGPDVEGQVQAVPLPVVASRDAAPRGTRLVLQGLARTRGGSISQLSLLNLGTARATCSATLLNLGGHRLGQLGPVEIRALSAHHFGDALGLVAGDWFGLGRAEVTCDQPFFAVHELRNPQEGTRAFNGPSSSPPLVYLPTVPDERGGTLRISVVNDAAANRRLITSLVPVGAAGPHGGRSLGTLWVGPSRTAFADQPLDPVGGLLALDIRPQMSVEARLLRGPDVEGQVQAVPVPVVAARDAAPAGSELVLHGLARTRGGSVSQLAVLNLGSARATCTATVYGAGGHRLGQLGPVEIRALSSHFFADLLAQVGGEWLAQARAIVSCDRPFFAVHELRNSLQGTRLFSGPAADLRGAAAAAPPPTPQPGPQPPPAPGGSVVFTQAGNFHTTTHHNPTRVFNIPVPAHTTFKRVQVRVDYTHGQWHPRNPSDQHSLFWLHRGVWLQAPWRSNVFGYANIWGPNSNNARVMINSNRGNVWTGFNGHAVLQPGVTYHLDYVYDGAGTAIRLTITNAATGAHAGQINGHAFGVPLRSDGSGHFFIYFGHEDHSCCGPERPSQGARWANLRVEFVR